MSTRNINIALSENDFNKLAILGVLNNTSATNQAREIVKSFITANEKPLKEKVKSIFK